MATPFHGNCHPAFNAVQAAFENNFAKYGEVGASMCLIVEGEKLVDVWGGHTGWTKREEWKKDTISLVFSNTKAATSLCAHILIDRGLLDLDAKVTEYWPEFGAAGKEHVTVRMMLCHQSAVPALRKVVKPGGLYDFDYMAGRLAAEKPFWAPGTDNGYHMLTFGWTVGELVRRVSGKSLGTFFKDEIADPLGLDFHIGLDDKHFGRMAKMISYKPSPTSKPNDFAMALMKSTRSIQFLSLMNTGGYLYDSNAAWRAEMGGGGGVANARALAQMFAPLLSEDSYLSWERVNDMRQCAASTKKDRTLLLPTRFGQGFMLNMDNRDQPGEVNSCIMGKGAFGHVGMGGSIGFCDPEAGFSFGYTMLKMGGGTLLNERGQALVDAVYQSLGYSNTDNGYWQR